MLTAQAAISRTRRDLALAIALKAVLVACVLIGCMLVQHEAARMALLAAVGLVWVGVSFTSAKGSRLVAGSTSLIAAGQYDEAEQQIEVAIRSFSVFRAAKLQTLHHLAMLRHAQRRWSESALLCRAVLGQRLGLVQGLGKSSRLILADALLELGDVRGTQEVIAALYQQRLSLPEVLHLLQVQLDYSAQVGAFENMMQGVVAKVQLAELMSAPAAARAQALLALAAQKIGRNDLCVWLRKRVELLTDLDQLLKQRPMLKEIWPSQ